MAVGSKMGRVVEDIRPDDKLTQLPNTVAYLHKYGAAQKQAARANAKKGKNELIGKDYPLRYKKELGEQRDKLLTLYEDLAVAGVNDPFTATDEGSLLFQRKVAEWGNNINFSKEIDKTLTSQEQLLQNQRPGYFDEASAQYLEQYKTLSLSEAMDKPLPNLAMATPYTNLFKYEETLSNHLKSIDPDYDPKFAAQQSQLLLDGLGNSADDEGVLNSLERKWNSLSEEKKQDIMNRAALNQVKAPRGNGKFAQMMADDLMNMKSAFDMNKFRDNVMADVKPRTVSGANEKYSSYSYSDKKDLEKQIRSNVAEKMRLDTRSFEEARQFLDMPGSTDKEVLKAMQDYAVQEWKPQMTDRWNKRVSEDSNEGDATQFQNQWVQDFTSDDTTLVNNAFDYLRSTITENRSGVDELKKMLTIPDESEITSVGPEDDKVVFVIKDEDGKVSQMKIKKDKFLGDMSEQLYSAVANKTKNQYKSLVARTEASRKTVDY